MPPLPKIPRFPFTPSFLISPCLLPPSFLISHLAHTVQKEDFSLWVPLSAIMPCLLKSTFLILLVLSVFMSSSEAKKKTKQKSAEDKTSGELSTKSGDRCTWQTREGKNNMVLQLKCSTPSKEAGLEPTNYECQFTGKPNECPAYKEKPTQYWKQVFGKLKKRESACEGSKVLKVAMCRSAPTASNMKLVREKTTSGKEGEKEEKKDDETMMGDEATSDGEAETESYCAKGWDPLCQFLIKLL